MALGKKKPAIQENAGGEVWIATCDADGSNQGTFAQIGYIAGTELADETSSTKLPDETGGIVKTTFGTREISFAVNLMQIDKDSMEFATKTSVGNYYTVVYKQTYEAISGNHQWFCGGICEVERSMSRSSPGTDGPTVTFNVLKNDSALTIDASTADSGLNAISIGASEYWSITEVAT